METHVSHVVPAWSFLLIALLILGMVFTAAVLAFAVFRKRGTAVGSLLLLGLAGLGLCLMVSLYAARHAAARQQANIQQLQMMSEEMQAHRVAAPSMIVLPIETTQGAPVESTSPLPEWVTAGTVHEGDRTLVVIHGQQFADEDTAWRDALAQAADLVQWDLDAELGYAPRVDVPADEHSVSIATGPSGGESRIDYPGRGRAIEYASDRWTLDPNVVESHAVRRSYTEEIRRTAGENQFTVYRTHLLVERSPEVRHAIEPIWRQQVGQSRSVLLVGVLLFLTAVAGLASGYFRLDDRTAGRFRWRLRFAAIAATVLIGGTLFAGTRIAAHAMRQRPVESPPVPVQASPMAQEPPRVMAPSPAPMPPVEPVFDVSAFDCPG